MFRSDPTKSPADTADSELWGSSVTDAQDRFLLDWLQGHAIRYFLSEWNPSTGLIADSTMPGAPCSIAATGMGLGMYPVAVERGDISRTEAAERTLTVLRFLHRSVQDSAPDATGHRGFYYHFLDMSTGRRVWECELSTIDTALLVAGVLAAAAYFADETAPEHEIRRLADALYHRVDWRWALDGGATLTHGWRPETGFLPYRWQGYDEAMILYLLALGSPTHAISPESYQAWTSTFVWRRSTTGTCSTPGRCSSTSIRSCGSTCGACTTPSCGRTTATTSRTAAAPPSSSGNTPSATRWGLRGTATAAGASPPATAPARLR